ncbi:hypothetical protein WN943_017541 [Citrus x changshan-huyou]
MVRVGEVTRRLPLAVVNSAVKATPPTSSPGTSRQRRSEAGEGTPTAQRKRQRLRPGTKALREIRRFQKSVDLLIPRMSFIREVSYMSVSVVFLYYACCELAYRISDALLNDVDAGVVRTITYRVAPPDVNRWTPEALIALQELEGREDPGCFGDILSQWFLLYL